MAEPAAAQPDAAVAGLATTVAAGRRKAEIDRRIVEAEKKLKDRAAARKGKGSGRLSTKEQNIDNSLNALLVRLRRGYLPGEIMSDARAPTDAVISSARMNSQHHASALSAPSGRPPARVAAAADGGWGWWQRRDDDDDTKAAMRGFQRLYGNLENPVSVPNTEWRCALPGCLTWRRSLAGAHV